MDNSTKIIKKNLRKKKLLKIYFALICICGRTDRHKWLRKHNIFGMFGDNVLYQPFKLPNEPKLIRIHNNVRIASGVTFYTHDVLHQMFSIIDKCEYRGHSYCIEIFDNCFIGGGSIITGNISIGPNAVVAAGSVVNKDVPPGAVVAGNPARVIGSFEELHQKRKRIDGNHSKLTDGNEIADELWTEYYNRRANC